jgi:hypothetical protein
MKLKSNLSNQMKGSQINLFLPPTSKKRKMVQKKIKIHLLCNTCPPRAIYGQKMELQMKIVGMHMKKFLRRGFDDLY